MGGLGTSQYSHFSHRRINLYLYLLTRTDNKIHLRNENAAVLIRAEDDPQARKIAAAVSGNEGGAIWLDDKTHCRVVTLEGVQEVIIISRK